MKQKNKTGKLIVLFLGVAVMVLVAGSAWASSELGEPLTKPEENPTDEQIEVSMNSVVSTVGIANSGIVSQKENVFELFFDITNEKGVQPQLIYAVQLLELDSNNRQYIVHEKVFEETLVLGSKDTVHKEVAYTAPDFLQGKFQLWLVIKNGNGLFEALSTLGEINLSGSGKYLDIAPDSCFISVEGEEEGKKYYLNQGVDINKEETMFLNCTANNLFGQEISATPFFANFWRNSSGLKVGEKKLEPLVFEANSEKMFKLEIPKAEKPQAYDAVLKFVDTDGEIISSNVVAHYVLRGVSATIQNLVLDKDYYAKGEVAKLSLNWTPSADSFPDSRIKNDAKNEQAILEVSILGEGKKCGEISKKQLTEEESSVVVEIPITANCVNPEVKVTLSDPKGNILDQSAFSVTSKNIPEGSNKNVVNDYSAEGRSMKSIALFVGIGLAVIGVIAIFVFRRRSSGKVLSLLLFVAVSLMIGQEVNAWGVDRWDNGDKVTNMYTATITPTTVLPGGAITASGTAYNGYCLNGKTRYHLWIVANGINDSEMISYYNEPTTETFYGSRTFYAPSAPGVYYAQFLGWGYDNYDTIATTTWEPSWHYLSYFVSTPAPTATPSCSGTNSVANITASAFSGASNYQIRIDTDTNLDNGFWYKNVSALSNNNTPEGFSGWNGFSNFSGYFNSGTTYYTNIAYFNAAWTFLGYQSPWASFVAKDCRLPVSSISASPTTINANGATTISWSSSSPVGYGTDCWVAGRYADNNGNTAAIGFPDAQYGGGNKSMTINLDRSATFYAYCWDWTGSEARTPLSDPKTVTVTVNQPSPAATISTSCNTNGTVAANFTWTESSQGSNGYYVDISTDNFVTWWNKGVASGTTTTDSSGFNPGSGVSGPLVLSSGATYYVRVYYIASGLHSTTATFSKLCPSCIPIATNPLNADTICANDGIGLNANRAKAPVAACTDDGNPLTDDDKCQYVCNSGYHYNAGSCVSNACSTVNPDPEGVATPISGDDVNVPFDNMATTLKPGNTSTLCEYECKDPYAYFLQGCAGAPCCLEPKPCPPVKPPTECSPACREKDGDVSKRTVYYWDRGNDNLNCNQGSYEQSCNVELCPDVYREVAP